MIKFPNSVRTSTAYRVFDRMSVLKSIIQSKTEREIRKHFKKSNSGYNGSESLNSHWHRCTYIRATTAQFLFESDEHRQLHFPTKSIKKGSRNVYEKKILAMPNCTRPASTLFPHKKHIVIVNISHSSFPYTRWHTHSRFKFNQYRSFLFVKFENFVKLEFSHSRSSIDVACISCLT